MSEREADHPLLDDVAVVDGAVRYQLSQRRAGDAAALRFYQAGGGFLVGGRHVGGGHGDGHRSGGGVNLWPQKAPAEIS